MKKIECHISEEKSQQIDKICEKECYTRAEFNRRALENHLWCLAHQIEVNPHELDNDKD